MTRRWKAILETAAGPGDINRHMDQPRVLHGAHADYSGLPNEGAVVFRADGSAMLLPNRGCHFVV